MIYYRFTLIDYTFIPAGDEYVINEPAGFDGFKITLARDADWHGVFSDFTVESLEVDGVGFDVLDAAYNEMGIEANVVLKIEYSCEGCDSGDCYSEVYRAKVDFGRSKRTCGDLCEWSIVLQPDSCINQVRARYDVKVDMDSTTAFDGITQLEEYPYLGIDIELPSKTILLQNSAVTELPISDAQASVQQLYFTIPFDQIDLEEIGEFAPSPTPVWDASAVDPDTDNIVEITETGQYSVSFRVKGTTTQNGSDPLFSAPTVRFAKYDSGGTPTVIDTNSPGGVSTGPASSSFTVDYSYSATITLDAGDRLLLYIYWSFEPFLTNITWDQDIESFFLMQQNSLYAATDSKMYLVHESLSHITEAITDNCMKVSSEYFGRTDSSPYSFAADGCGALEAITNGLLIRRAVMQDGTTPKFTISLKELFDALQAIHAVGMGMDEDSNGNEILTVEPITEFYTEDIVLTVDNNNLIKTIDEQGHFAKVLIGYSKWEAEEYNGLDEFLTRREYRTNLSQTNGVFQQLSEIIASGYAIEITRRKGPSSEDWRYDNDNFIICLKRNDTYGQMLDVEQGNITNPTNIIDPDTIYNYRISPIRNLLRWLWYIMASYRKPNDTASVLTFSAGDGNMIASGIMEDSTCRLEGAIIAENATIDLSELATYAPPIWFPERVEFTCPLTYTDFQTIQENKYGLIAYICNGTTAYGWISRMEYDLTAGEANFILIPKRDA